MGLAQPGFILPAGNPKNVSRLADLPRLQVVRRQAQAGSQLLLDRLLAEEGLAGRAEGPMARDEREAALAVLDGSADLAFGLEASARQFKLDFIPVCQERFDLIVGRRDWFEPPLQALQAFTRTQAFAEMARTLGGYRIEGIWTPLFNGG